MKKFLLAASVISSFAEANLDPEKEAMIAELFSRYQDMDAQERVDFKNTPLTHTEFFWRERLEIKWLMDKLFNK
jgi:hypothetical protein